MTSPGLSSCARLRLSGDGWLTLQGKLLDGVDLEQHFGSERASAGGMGGLSSEEGVDVVQGALEGTRERQEVRIH